MWNKIYLLSLIVVLCIGFSCLFFSLTSCSSTPEILRDADGNVIECQQCYHYRICVEAARKMGQPISGCNYDPCNRMLIYLECEKIKDPVEKQNCWIKLK